MTYAIGRRQTLTFTDAVLADQKTPNLLTYSGNVIVNPWGSDRRIVPYVAGGEATVANIQLRCRPHNGYEADVFFGAHAGRRDADAMPERAAKPAVSWEFSPVPERPRPPLGHRSRDSGRNR